MPRALSGLMFTMLLAAQAQAQPSNATRPDPLDPKSPVPSVRYESSFAQFRRMGDDKPLGWREANDTVARIGGWRVYAREAQQADPAAADKPTAPAPAPAQAPPITPASNLAPAPAPASAAKPMPGRPLGHKH